MAGNSSGQEKTEQPTSKRRKDARKEGNVLQSKDISTVVLLLGVFWMIRVMMPYIYKSVRTYMEWILEGVGGDVETFLSARLAVETLTVFLQCSMPLLLTAMVLGILAHGVQTRFNVSFQSIKPKFSKLNPISGIKKMFALKNVVELLKNLFKITLLVILLYNLLKKDLVPVARMIDMLPQNAAVYTLNMAFDLVIKVSMAFTVVAFFDFLYQRWEYEKDLKMTKQEVKDEFKQTEGNPEIKSRIRKIQRQMALSRMMQMVPQADVIIKNPTHFAVALKYDPDHHNAPVVIAKGQDELALRIIKVGEENGVYIMENRPLARALHDSCELGREIPAEFYGAVAEVLLYLFATGRREDLFR